MARRPTLLRQLEDSLSLVEQQKDERRRLQLEHLARAARSLLLSDPNQVGTSPKRRRNVAKTPPSAVQQPTELLLYCEGLLTMLLRAPRAEGKIVCISTAEADRICRQLDELLKPFRLAKAA